MVIGLVILYVNGYARTMPNPTAELISQALRTGLVWPGDPARGIEPRPIALPFNMSGAGQPKEMNDLMDEAVKQIGEAIVALLESDGKTIVDADEVADLRAVASDAPPPPLLPVHCRCDPKGTPLVMLSVTHADRCVIDGGALIRSLSARDPKCPHKTKGD